MSVNISPFAFRKPGPEMGRSDQEKVDWYGISVASVDLKDYPFGHEMLGVEININTRLNAGHKVILAVEFYNEVTGKLLWASGSVRIPDPTSSGFNWWDYWNHRFWIGHVLHEISEAMMVKAVVHVSGSPLMTTNYTVRFQVKNTAYIPPDPPVTPAPNTRKGKRIVIYYKDKSPLISGFQFLSNGWVGGGAEALGKKLAPLADQIVETLHVDWRLINITHHTGELSLEFEDTGTPLLAIPVIVFIVMGFLIALGLIVTSWKVFDWKKTEAQAAIETQDSIQDAEDSDLLQKLVDAGIVKTPEDAQLIIDALNKDDIVPPPPDIQTIIMYAVGAIIIIMVLQQTGKTGS